MRRLIIGILAIGMVGLLGATEPEPAAAANVFTTTITVNTTVDTADSINFDNHTCGWTAGAFFFPSGDGLCTLREALLEAAKRPDADRPILIEFDIPAVDPDCAAAGYCEVQLDETYAVDISRRFITDDGGQITIDGSTQAGRATGPTIMVNTNRDNNPLFGVSLEFRTSNNTVRHLGFHGGGQIILYEGGNTVEDNWMGLRNNGNAMKLASTASAQAKRSMARGGIIMPNAASDNNTIQNNIIIGAFERAIRVTSGGDGNVITNNWIGMNKSGDVPVTGTVDCTRDVDYQTTLWYGGRGIQVNGTNSTITNNRLAGLHVTQAAGDTPPISMEISGSGNTIEGNIVGIDVQGDEVGVCGQGLLLQGTTSEATDNHFFFTRNGFDPNDIGTEFDSTIITQSFAAGAGQWLKVWNNVIDGGDYPEATYHSYRFSSPGVPIEVRQFHPASVTSISGTLVSGTNGPDSILGYTGFCPGCTVFLYADDRDDRIEAFELLGQAIADANGDWSTTLSRPLSGDEGIRTQSMANSANVMGNTGANTTSELSDILYGGPVLDAVPLADVDSDGHGELAVLLFDDAAGRYQVVTRDATDEGLVSTADLPLTADALDLEATAAGDLVVLYRTSTNGFYRVKSFDAATGASGVTVTLGALFDYHDLEITPAGDWATIGTSPVDGRVRVRVDDPVAGSFLNYTVFGTVYSGDDLEVTPAGDLAVMGSRPDGVVRTRVVDPSDSSWVQFLFGSAYSGDDLEVTAAGDVVVMGTRPSDGLVRAREIDTGTGAGINHRFGTVFTGADLEILASGKVAVMGERPSDDQVRTAVQNGALVAYLYGKPYTGVDLVETTAGELAVLGENRTSGQVRVRHINPTGGAVTDIFYP